MTPPTSPAAHRLLRRARATGHPIAVIYVGADTHAHYREGRVTAIDGSRFVLAYLDPAGTARLATFDLANPDDVLAVELLR
jgi:hypothetical protein